MLIIGALFLICRYRCDRRDLTEICQYSSHSRTGLHGFMDSPVATGDRIGSGIKLISRS